MKGLRAEEHLRTVHFAEVVQADDRVHFWHLILSPKIIIIKHFYIHWNNESCLSLEFAE